MELAEIPDELMMYVVKTCVVDEALLVFIGNLKQTSKQMQYMVHREMAKNVAYRELVKKLLLVVPGTRIACGATHTPEPPFITGIAQLLHKFNSEMLTADNGVGIGGTYTSDGGFLQHSVVQDTDDNTYLVAVNIYFKTATYLTGLPSMDEHLTDLSRVPNVVRSVLGMTGLTGSIAHANYCVEWDLVGKYTRMVRVNSEHTLQNIQDAIAWREGLVFEGFVVHMHTRDVEPVLTAQTSVAEFLQIRHDSTISTCLQVWWDGHLRPYPDSSDDENSEEEDVDDDDVTGTVVPTAMQVPTPSVIPVDYPSDDILITSEETLDDSDPVANEQIDTFYM